MSTNRRRLGNARHLRAKMTEAEQLLWERLRDRQVLGAKFQRQHAFRDYIATFACAEARLVLEVDEPARSPESAAHAVKRNVAFQEAGFRVLRFERAAVLQETNAVLEFVAAALNDAAAGV